MRGLVSCGVWRGNIFEVCCTPCHPGKSATFFRLHTRPVGYLKITQPQSDFHRYGLSSTGTACLEIFFVCFFKHRSPLPQQQAVVVPRTAYSRCWCQSLLSPFSVEQCHLASRCLKRPLKNILRYPVKANWKKKKKDTRWNLTLSATVSAKSDFCH